MKIESVHIKNLLSFKNFNITLDETNNIIVGTNGVGKSNFLKLIHYLLSNKTAELEEIHEHGSCIFIKIKFDDYERRCIKVLYILNIFFDELKYKNNNNTNNSSNQIIEIVNSICSYIDDRQINDENIHQLFEIIDENAAFKNIKISSEYINKRCYVNYHWKNQIGNNSLSIDNEIKMVINKIINDIGTDATIKHNATQKILIDDNDYIKCINNYFRHEITDTDFYNIVINHNIGVKNMIENSVTFISGFNNYNNTRFKFLEFKNKEWKKYNKISTIYNDITGKTIDIIFDIVNKEIKNIKYVNRDDEKKLMYECSLGEEELITFLVEYYGDNKIILIDEPCVHLNGILINKLTTTIFDDTNTQFITVTHNENFITDITSKNIIRFYLNDNTNYVMLNILDNEKDRKNVLENKKVFFSEKCLLVEGYHDYRFMIQFLKVIDRIDYAVIIMNGKLSKLPQLLNILKINYKALYDVDMIYGKSENILNNKKSYRTIINKNCIFRDMNLDSELIKLLQKYYSQYKDLINCLQIKIDKNNRPRECNTYIRKIRKKSHDIYNEASIQQFCFVWDKTIKDIEGIGIQLFGEEIFIKNETTSGNTDHENDINYCIEYNKNGWYKLSNYDMVHKIEENIESNNYLKQLKKFVNDHTFNNMDQKIIKFLCEKTGIKYYD